MKRTNILAALLVALSLISTGCGTSDYVQSVQLTSTGANTGGFFNLSGQDGTLQLLVNEVYHSGKTIPVTNSVTYTVTPTGCQSSGDPSNPCGTSPVPLPAYGPTTVPIDSTGLMTAVASLCTWIDIPSGTPPVLPTPPQYNWLYTGYYQVTATYNGMVSQPVAIGVGSLAGNAPDGSCGPK
ncbi:MAG: hypothetical protein WCC99_13840 [Candidatus Sulfotelmatobacter sp.]